MITTNDYIIAFKNQPLKTKFKITKLTGVIFRRHLATR